MKILAQNKKALFNYEIIDKFEAGMVLEGWEVKSMKNGAVSIKEGYIIVKDMRVWLVGAYVSKWPGATIPKDQEKRDKELLLHLNEINKLLGGMKMKGQTITPLDIHLNKGKVKVNLALVKGKKLYDKRSKLKEKDQEREVERDLKHLAINK